jgi:aspartyl-tRNA(Asn)/glutamyl-tRNA(Gln) amidotransferase subunit C
MAVTKNDIQYIAKLAHLGLSEEEAEKFANDMEIIIRSWMDKLNELDTSMAEPMEYLLDLRNVLREDKCETSFDREEILKNAPDQANGCFRVPNVFDMD